MHVRREIINNAKFQMVKHYKHYHNNTQGTKLRIVLASPVVDKAMNLFIVGY